MTDPSIPPVDVSALLDADWPEWRSALEDIRREFGNEGVRALLRRLQEYSIDQGVTPADSLLNTPYTNTIAPSEQPAYPGDLDLEKRIENIIRWNAAAMILRAQDAGAGLGGHIATYASAATAMETAFHHIFSAAGRGDLVLPQPHAAPGVYARAFLEGRLSEQQLCNYRRELGAGGGLSSYPHPRSMPDFWQVPNASMGLSVPISIYIARYAKYLQHRGLLAADDARIWCFIGDGEADEPEVLGTINIAARERLDNLVLVVNCNLQRLDGPVRGNGKIIQELERAFRGADWQVLKVIWGSGWDALLAADHDGVLRHRMEECLDGDYQRYSILPGDQQREHWVHGDPRLEQLMNTLTDAEVAQIKRGGQDPKKLYAAYRRACESEDRPTVILVKTVKGDGMGSALQGRNTAHQKKDLSRDERIACAHAWGIPLDEDAIARADFYRPAEESEEIAYLRAQREVLGGYLPKREVAASTLAPPDAEVFDAFNRGSDGRPLSTTSAMVRLLTKLLKDPNVGEYVVPIVPDEARTFGMDALFKVAGIYSPDGQRYTPVDAESLNTYREAIDGQILQEGICEAGAIASFIAAGTAYATFSVPTIPFYIFYSMFGFQRVGDMIWASADMMARGFLLGGTAGRTTLNGEGLQHQDGHSPILASTVPSVRTYDPAFAWELAILVGFGIQRMFIEDHDELFYLMMYNEALPMPARPELPDLDVGVTRGGYLLEPAAKNGARINLLGSGTILFEVQRAAEQLRSQGYAVAVYSITSYVELARDAERAEIASRTAAGEGEASWISQLFDDPNVPTLAVTDYMTALPRMIASWMPGPYTALGANGFGLSERREELRAYFKIDATSIVETARSLVDG
ncbi:MAG: pyruvate dehydrogenase (acetyl-transferring), homodimeric type [Luminiphilus sp.]|jgi:pyruvate dehydrogenase E1 component|nr:pyruvate dehydrogenase (acetyl-transferring), homodimeric type [Luminiphilus sp.]